MTDEIRSFIREHADADVRQLAFTASRLLGEDAAFALDQIAGRQTARRKLPSWAAVPDVIFPPHLSMEQCSSEETALYKAECLKRYVKDLQTAQFIDLTGGFGVDFSIMSRGFGRSIYVERLPHLCDIARHNLPLLGIGNAEVVNGDAEEQLATLPLTPETAVFMDPARRNSSGGRTYAISDCTPNILSFIGNLLSKVSVVMVKLSPMLDWHATVADINSSAGKEAVREVHIVSTANECKELLLVLSTRLHSPATVHCVNDNQQFSYNIPLSEPTTSSPYFPPPLKGETGWVFLPNASVMKAGCFALLEQRFGINQIAPSSHLFLSDHEVEGFPGRQYKVAAISSMNKKELKSTLTTLAITHANISCRNFPLTPDQLRKRLKLKDGGTHHIFATTTQKGDHILVFCKIEKISA